MSETNVHEEEKKEVIANEMLATSMHKVIDEWLLQANDESKSDKQKDDAAILLITPDSLLTSSSVITRAALLTQGIITLPGIVQRSITVALITDFNAPIPMMQFLNKD